MNITQRYEKVKQLLAEYNQSHLLTFWSKLNEKQKLSLLSQIEQIDFDQLKEKINTYIKNYATAELPEKISAAPAYPAIPKTREQKEKYTKAKQLGAELISAGKVAPFIVAGGQGTRLGFDGPKGDFAISPVKNKTLFRLFAETIKAAGQKYGFQPVWYVMTSPLNHSQTTEIFERDNYYGLDKSSVFVFQQGTEVNFSPDGKILLAAKYELATSPDGHGGSLKALYKSGAVEDMKNRGIEYISYFQVDNPLTNIFDPLFIGLHALDKAQMSSKALTKTGPFERVGNFCLANGKVTIIEYSDLPDELAEKKTKEGLLVFSLGSIAIHMITRTFVEQLNNEGFALPYHRANKKISYIDLQTGKKIEPTKPNGIKLETFVFDALPLTDKSIILETIRSEEFAPVKNAIGTDSPQVTKKMMVARAAAWLTQAGIKIPQKPDNSPDCKIEIAPSFAICPQDVQKKKDKVEPVNPGDMVCLT
ncbi:MAG: UDPGP type 1 family protein [Sedimentisphaerales bacterium]|nr:UDPGP type 1 family protein [Sedimentisphaerales bacterium]